jgi:hypothetical protein
VIKFSIKLGNGNYFLFWEEVEEETSIHCEEKDVKTAIFCQKFENFTVWTLLKRNS